MVAPYICQVLVVGAGPVGLAGALELRRRQVSLKIIEKELESSRTSNAVAINARSLELLEPSGATEKLLAAGTRIRRINQYFEGRKLASVDFSRMQHRFNFMLALPQNETEQILENVLNEAGVQVERGATLTAIEKTGQGVLATAERENQEPLQFNTGFVLGADGLHSKVRQLAGIEFAGERYSDQFSLADVEIDWDFPYDEGQIFMRKDKPFLFVIAIGQGRHRIVSNYPNSLD
ncbi:MAG: FAD-dependent monooxygenase, partial [Gammaproteobacteria bacterium]